MRTYLIKVRGFITYDKEHGSAATLFPYHNLFGSGFRLLHWHLHFSSATLMERLIIHITI